MSPAVSGAELSAANPKVYIIAGVQGMQYTNVFDCASNKLAALYGLIPYFFESGLANDAPTVKIAGAFRPIIAESIITITEIVPSADLSPYAIFSSFSRSIMSPSPALITLIEPKRRSAKIHTCSILFIPV